MKFEIRCIGKLNCKAISSLSEDFAKRIPYKIEIIEKPQSKKKEIADIKSDEANQLLKNIADNALLIAMDEKGKEYTSYNFADFIKKNQIGEYKKIIFFIGGAYGLDEKIRQKCHLSLSLSKMTMPHKFARLMLIEQIYRAYTIIQGHPYHKD